jgi:hypothetical protein
MKVVRGQDRSPRTAANDPATIAPSPVFGLVMEVAHTGGRAWALSRSQTSMRSRVALVAILHNRRRREDRCFVAGA